MWPAGSHTPALHTPTGSGFLRPAVSHLAPAQRGFWRRQHLNRPRWLQQVGEWASAANTRGCVVVSAKNPVKKLIRRLCSQAAGAHASRTTSPGRTQGQAVQKTHKSQCRYSTTNNGRVGHQHLQGASHAVAAYGPQHTPCCAEQQPISTPAALTLPMPQQLV